ncbi:MAG TPA: hypothetical protein VH619_20830 [Verrucomicrobiae bacterium]|jgi:hypothetical protein|nr:hypothetical protein [Verrucomicrobiae bacterium]
MTHVEILKELKNLPAAERLSIVESTVHQLREELEDSGARPSAANDAQLARAAEALRADYSSDKELTAFTALDGDPFHA